MSDLIKAMNPTATLTTEAEALAAARSSAIAIFLGVVFGALGVFMMLNGGMKELETAMGAAAGSDPALAGMGSTMAQVTLYSAIAMVVVQLILGFVQWTRPGKVIPILFIVLVVYGIGSTALSQMMADQMNTPQTSLSAPWFVTLGYVVMVVELVLHIAGVRGASKLDQIRMASAQ